MPDTPLRPLWQWLIFGHLWLALCAAAQVWWTGMFIAEAPLLWRYTAAVALGTFSGYGMMRLARARAPEHVHYANLRWYQEHRILMTWLVALASVGAFVLMWPLWPLLWRWLVPVSVVALLYVTPFTDGKGRSIGLRSIPYLKPFLISALWVVVTVAVPLQLDVDAHGPALSLGMACMRFPLILALSVVFDIRDLDNDDPALRTMPHVLGVRGTKALAVLLLLGSLALETIFLRGLDYRMSSFTLLLGYAAAFVLVLRARPERDPVYYAILVDGIMLLVPLCVWSGTWG